MGSNNNGFEPQEEIFRQKMQRQTSSESNHARLPIIEPFFDEDTATKPSTLARPSMYAVVLLNDDNTPMEYVMYVLEKFFHKSYSEAQTMAYTIHELGQGVCGIYTREVAESKITEVITISRQNQHPLKCFMRKA